MAHLSIGLTGRRLQRTLERQEGAAADATDGKSRAYLDLSRYRAVRWGRSRRIVVITLNGEPHELEEPVSVTDLLTRLSIDPRRVAIEHNLTILKRQLFDVTIVNDGDRIEIVNFVGGGSSCSRTFV